MERPTRAESKGPDAKRFLITMESRGGPKRYTMLAIVAAAAAGTVRGDCRVPGIIDIRVLQRHGTSRNKREFKAASIINNPTQHSYIFQYSHGLMLCRLVHTTGLLNNGCRKNDITRPGENQSPLDGMPQFPQPLLGRPSS